MKPFLTAGLILVCLLRSQAEPAGHPTALRGIVNISGLQGALLEVGRSSYFARTGDHFQELRTNGEPMQIDVLALDLNNEILKTRIDGENHTNSLPVSNRPTTARSWLHLRDADFNFLLQIFGKLSGRVLLIHPGISHAAFSCEASWTNLVPNKDELSDCFAHYFKQRDAVFLADGDVFLQIIPTAAVSKTSRRAKDLPRVEREKISAGTIDFQGVDAGEVVEIYGKLIGRQRVGSEPVMGNIYFRASQPLTKEEVSYAFETLLGWNGNKIILNNDQTFRVVRISPTTMLENPH